MSDKPSSSKNDSKASPDTAAVDQSSPGPKKISNFWAKYIEKQKLAKANANSTNLSGSSKNKSSGDDAGGDSSSKKNRQFEPIKIKPNRPLNSSILERKSADYRRKLQNTTNLLILLLRTDKRIQGREHHLTYIVSMKSRTDPGRKNYYIICLLLYQCLLGAFGGILVGFQTRFLSPNRFPPPNVPIPLNWNLPLTRQTGVLFIKAGSLSWRMFKRGLISGILFDNIDRKVEQFRNKRDWKNTGIAGGLCGSIFGLRGGFYGPLQCFLSFGLIGALGGYLFINNPNNANNRPNSSGNNKSRWL